MSPSHGALQAPRQARTYLQKLMVLPLCGPQARNEKGPALQSLGVKSRVLRVTSLAINPTRAAGKVDGGRLLVRLGVLTFAAGAYCSEDLPASPLFRAP